MAGLSVEDLQARLQAYLNCLELCRVLHKQTDDPGVRASLDSLISDLHEILASLASHLRQRGVAPGTHQLDRPGKAQIREVLGTRSLLEQLRVVRRSLADLVAWYDRHPPSDRSDPSDHDWLASLSAQTKRMLGEWDHHMHEMGATPS
jgi:hypothetical protein